MSIKEQTISGVKWTTVTTVTLALLSLIKIAILARLLSITDFGLMALISFVLGFAGLFMDMGLTTAILHKQNISKNEYASLYWINLIFSIVLFLIIMALSPLIARVYLEESLTFLIPLASLSIILSAIGQQFKTIKQKNLNFRFIAVTEIIAAFVGLFVGVIMAENHYGVLSLVYAALAQYTVSNLIYFVEGIRSRGLVFHFKFQETKEFLRIGMYQVGGQIVNYFNRDIDILLIGKFLGTEILGGYSLAKQLVSKPMMILNPIVTTVASPVLALLQKDKNELKNKFLYFLNVISTANFIAYLLMGIFAYPIVYLIYGIDFIHIVVIVQILSIYMFLRSTGNPIGSLVIATGRTDLEFYWNLFVLFITPIVIFIGAQYSVELVALLLVFVMLLLLYPSWRFMVAKMINVSFREYVISLLPRWKRLFILFRDEMKKMVKTG